MFYTLFKLSKNIVQREERSGLTEMWGWGRGRNLKPCNKCETLEHKCREEKNMEKENMGKGKERVLNEKFCNHVSERFHKGSKLKRLWVWALWRN